MNKDKIIELLENNQEDIQFAEQLSQQIVGEVSAELDRVMGEIHCNIVQAEDAPDNVIEHYFLELTSMLYYVGAMSENFGFKDDITKANARVKYMEAYSENQIKGAENKIKTTVADNQLYAETQSLDETMLNLIYSRSVKIMKSKIEAAEEMVRTLSKVLSAHMANAGMNRNANNFAG